MEINNKEYNKNNEKLLKEWRISKRLINLGMGRGEDREK